jgi:hypothetical protein
MSLGHRVANARATGQKALRWPRDDVPISLPLNLVGRPLLAAV